jgi:hypothetical protein
MAALQVCSESKTNSTLVWSATAQQKRYVTPRKEDLGGRQALVETAVTASHFEWWLPSLRGHERYAHSPSRNIVLPSMRLVVHTILTGSSLAIAVLTGATGWIPHGIQHRGLQRLMAACRRRALSPYGTLVRSHCLLTKS